MYDGIICELLRELIITIINNYQTLIMHELLLVKSLVYKNGLNPQSPPRK